MKRKELKALPRVELESKRTELYKELMKNSAQIALGSALKNPGKVRVVRKTVARINTLLAQSKEVK